MKLLLHLLLFLFLFSSSVLAQLRVEFLNVSASNDGILVAEVFVQNLGRRTAIRSACGTPFPALEAHCEFFATYESTPTNRSVRINASSIMVKTILGASAMDQFIYEMPSTGISAGQHWEVLFIGIPADAGSVEVSIVGAKYLIGDMPDAKSARIERRLKAERVRTAGELLISESQYLTGIDSLKLAKQLEPYDCVSCDSLMGVAYFAQAKILQSLDEHLNAVSMYESASKADRSLAAKCSQEIAESYCIVAEASYDLGDWSDAIVGWQAALSRDTSVFTECQQPLASAYFSQAENHFERRMFRESGVSFRVAMETDPSLEDKVRARVSKIRRSATGVAVTSLVPGLGQFRNGQKAKGTIHLLAFAGLVALSILESKNADREYAEYKRATSSSEASLSYQRTQDAWTRSMTAGGLASSVLIWSVVDAFITRKSINRNFELGDGRQDVKVSVSVSPATGILFVRLGF